jgi:hypothetical protein
LGNILGGGVLKGENVKENLGVITGISREEGEDIFFQQIYGPLHILRII